MLGITLCCNRDIISTWSVRKSVLRLGYFEKNYIFTCYEWYELCMNGYVSRSIGRPTPFVKTCNENLKWNMNVHVRTCSYDVYEYTYVVFVLWECYVVKSHEDRINKSIICVTCRSTLLYKLVMIMRLEHEYEPMSMKIYYYRHVYWVFVLWDCALLMRMKIYYYRRKE
jgi:hypothetical protein